jgi:hypothetical protein
MMSSSFVIYIVKLDAHDSAMPSSRATQVACNEWKEQVSRRQRRITRTGFWSVGRRKARNFTQVHDHRHHGHEELTVAGLLLHRSAGGMRALRS